MKFTPTSTIELIDQGNTYASKTFFDPNKKRQILWSWIIEEDNGAIARGWAGFAINFVFKKFNLKYYIKKIRVQSLPCELHFDKELSLISINPITELSSLRSTHYSRNEFCLTTNQEWEIPIQGDQLEISGTFELGDSCQYEIRVRRANDTYKPIYYTSAFVNYESNKRILTTGWNLQQSGSQGSTSNTQTQVPLKTNETTFNLHLFVDHSMLELFAQQGRRKITRRVYTNPVFLGISLFSQCSLSVHSIDIWKLGTIWSSN